MSPVEGRTSKARAVMARAFCCRGGARRGRDIGAPRTLPARILRSGRSALQRSRASCAPRFRDAPAHQRRAPASRLHVMLSRPEPRRRTKHGPRSFATVPGGPAPRLPHIGPPPTISSAVSAATVGALAPVELGPWNMAPWPANNANVAARAISMFSIGLLCQTMRPARD